MNSGRIRIVYADDHALIREGIAALIADTTDMELVGEASTGREAIEMFRRHQPDVTLMDLKMPDIGGIEAIRTIRSACPTARIIVLTTFRGDVIAQRAMNEGARAFVLKGEMRKELFQTIRDVHAGRIHLNSQIAAELAGSDPADALSLRETTVLELISKGNSNRQIGIALHIAEGTVKNHVKSILAKLKASDRTHAAMLGLERGIIGL